jgi:single-strand DNA-binding protein
MKDINNLTVTGRAVADPKIIQAGQTEILNFAIACNDIKRVNEEWVDDPSFFDCSAFGVKAKIFSERIKKGTLMTISGKLKQDRWEADGQRKSKIKIICSDIVLAPAQKIERPEVKEPDEKGAPEIPDFEDIPF